ncbi:phage tail protein [Tateyamaria omphalii]|uniref:phage tail protein n=1 Tax=Tateyamaria omphalii TaxID=299262 RepID=UPI001C993F84|nr:phage tail protein [Tateyamaria omphalii]MBY5934780.1 phage tail protein [Tateyamaria omphalii]
MTNEPNHTQAFVFLIAVGDATAGFFAQEVSGLGATLETEPVVEGGENRFVHQLPKPVKHVNLTIKRFALKKTDPVIAWVRDTLEGNLSEPITPKSVAIDLMDNVENTVASWNLKDVYPVAWSVDRFDAMEDEIMVERIELAYGDIVRDL